MEPSTERRRHSWSMSDQPGNSGPVPAKAYKADAVRSKGLWKLNTRCSKTGSCHREAYTTPELAAVLQDF